MPTQFARVYDAIAEFGSLYALPPDWSSLEVDSDCRLLGDPVAAFARLTEQFAAAHLVGSGIARQSAGGLEINPLLAAEDGGFIVLRKANGTAFDVVTAAGCVSGAVPVLTIVHDRVAQQGIAASPRKPLFATFSMVDTVLLRSLGVAAAPAAHLQTLDLMHLQRLLMLVGGVSNGDVSKQAVQLPDDEEDTCRGSRTRRPDEESAKFSLILVAASISAMTAAIPATLHDVARHLADAERHLGFAWQRIRVWHPTPQNLEDLQFRRDFCATEVLRQYFLVQAGKHPLKAFERPGPPVIPTPTLGQRYFDLLKKQQARDKDPFKFADIIENPQASQQMYDEFVDKHFVRPVVEKALQCQDPEERTLCMEIAALARLHHRMLPALFDLLRRAPRRTSPTTQASSCPAKPFGSSTF